MRTGAFGTTVPRVLPPGFVVSPRMKSTFTASPAPSNVNAKSSRVSLNASPLYRRTLMELALVSLPLASVVPERYGLP